MCECLDSGIKYYTFAMQSVLLPHAAYLLAPVLWDKNCDFGGLRQTPGRTRFKSDQDRGPRSRRSSFWDDSYFPSLFMHWLTLMEQAKPLFPVVFASDKAVISGLTFPWEQTFTSLTLASLVGWDNSLCDPDPAVTCMEPSSSSAN